MGGPSDGYGPIQALNDIFTGPEPEGARADPDSHILGEAKQYMFSCFSITGTSISALRQAQARAETLRCTVVWIEWRQGLKLFFAMYVKVKGKWIEHVRGQK